jgi:DNA-directed RNA polymerase specialized sigma24 family protein
MAVVTFADYKMTYIKLDWAELLLTAYKRIPQIIKGVENLIAERALRGISVNCESLTDSIIRDIESKTILQNIEQIVDSALDRLNTDERCAVVCRIWGESHRERATRLGVSLRTVFRHYNEGLDRFARVLEARGYDEAWFSDQFDKLDYLARIEF